MGPIGRVGLITGLSIERAGRVSTCAAPLDPQGRRCYDSPMRNTESHDEDEGAARFSVSMDPELLARFEGLLQETGWSRSKAIRDMVRSRLAESELETGSAVGVLSYVYAHEQPDLAHRLMHVQHDAHSGIVSSTHIHLDRHECLEVLILRGPAIRLKQLANRLLALKGVRQGHLTLNPARCPLAAAHQHSRHGDS
jgi:CopG family transcriptional regulator, nickel-responsive regulator